MSLKPKVVIVWIASPETEFGDFNILVCREGVRVFSKDVLDERLKPLPYFDNIEKAHQFMVEHGGGSSTSVQLDLEVARKAGYLHNLPEVVFS